MKFAVLLFLLIPFVAKADSICVEDNTTKCRELGYTESSCPNGGVACQYDTSLWYCANWSCADGRLYSADNRPDGAECVETAYKNLTCYECQDIVCNSTTCAVGDVFYSDGTCCPVEKLDRKKTPIGVVYALSATKGGIPYTTAQAETPGFKAEHGRVIALKDMTGDSTYLLNPLKPFNGTNVSLPKGLYGTNATGITNYTEANLLTAFQNNTPLIYNGKLNTSHFASTTPTYNKCTNGTYTVGTADYNTWCTPTIAQEILKFYPPDTNMSDTLVGAGNWYLMSIGELALLNGLDVSKMTSATDKSGATGTTKAIVNATLKALANKGVSATVLSTFYYWSSVSYSHYYSYLLQMSDGKRIRTTRNVKDYVRPSLEF